MALIEYDNKVALNENPNISDINKVKAEDMNEIKSVVNENAASLVPAGAITQFAGNQAPTGWIICDGSAISRTTYADLFAVIGTTYGTGDGSTTFNIPDYRGKVPVGYDSTQTEFDTLGETGGEKKHTLTIDEMPSHNHKPTSSGGEFAYQTWKGTPGVDPSNGGSGSWNGLHTGTTSSTGGGQAHNILQPYLVVNYIIKY